MHRLEKHQIVGAFPKKHRRHLVTPQLERVQWEQLEFLGWVDLGSSRGFIVMEHRGILRGLLLTRSSASAQKKASMCELCKTIHQAQGVRLFVAEHASDARKTVGNYFCDDLQCSLRVRRLIPVPPNQMPETLGPEEKAVRILEEVEAFFDRIY